MKRILNKFIYGCLLASNFILYFFGFIFGGAEMAFGFFTEHIVSWMESIKKKMDEIKGKK